MKSIWQKVLTAVAIAIIIGFGTIIMGFYNATQEKNREVPILKEIVEENADQIQQNYDDIISIETNLDKYKSFQKIKDTLMQTKLNYAIMKIDEVLTVVKEKNK